MIRPSLAEGEGFRTEKEQVGLKHKAGAFIFDMDGVIIDSEPIHSRVKMDTFHHFGLSFNEADLVNYMGRTSEAIFGEVLAKAEHLKKWAEEVSAYALEQALAGEHYDGWKLVEGRSNRKYADEIQVADKLKAAGFDEAMLYQRKLYGITEMEKLVGKKKLAATLGDLLIKPAGKPVLVPESDKREAINTTEAAQADFTTGDDEVAPF